jgi:hypothetical protein
MMAQEFRVAPDQLLVTCGLLSIGVGRMDFEGRFLSGEGSIDLLCAVSLDDKIDLEVDLAPSNNCCFS